MRYTIVKPVTYLFLLTSILLNISCNKALQAEIPTYIQISNFHYNGSSQGQIPHDHDHHSTKITDAWITMDGQFLGVFELPCTIPAIYDKNQSDTPHSFDIYPGIKVNGIAASRIKYPFYEKFEIDTILNENENIILAPNTKYKDQVLIRFDEEGKFEQKNNTILSNIDEDNNTYSTTFHCTNSSANSAAPIIQENVVFQGNQSLAIHLDNNHNNFHIRTDTLDLQGTTFLELNFKTSTVLRVGLYIINTIISPTPLELIQLHATEEWKKTYLDLTPLINQGYSDSQFQVYFEACSGNTYSEESIYIDNIKLISNE